MVCIDFLSGYHLNFYFHDKIFAFLPGVTAIGGMTNNRIWIDRIATVTPLIDHNTILSRIETNYSTRWATPPDICKKLSPGIPSIRRLNGVLTIGYDNVVCINDLKVGYLSSFMLELKVFNVIAIQVNDPNLFTLKL